jgi:hypothetical protein
MLLTNLKGAFMLWANLDGANITGAILPAETLPRGKFSDTTPQTRGLTGQPTASYGASAASPTQPHQAQTNPSHRTGSSSTGASASYVPHITQGYINPSYANQNQPHSASQPRLLSAPSVPTLVNLEANQETDLAAKLADDTPEANVSANHSELTTSTANNGSASQNLEPKIDTAPKSSLDFTSHQSHTSPQWITVPLPMVEENTGFS